VLASNGQATIAADAIGQGLTHTRWPGRIEVVRQHPLVILDGAHNLASARTLAKHLRTTYRGRSITMVVGILADKPYAKILASFAKVSTRMVLTRPTIDRALEPQQLRAALPPLSPPCRIIDTVGQAVAHAIDTAAGDEVVCIAGSLYVVGEAKAFLAGEKPYTI